MDMSLSKLQEVVKVREACHAGVQRVGHDWVIEQQQLTEDSNYDFSILNTA